MDASVSMKAAETAELDDKRAFSGTHTSPAGRSLQAGRREEQTIAKLQPGYTHTF